MSTLKIPSLRPESGGVPFPGTELPDLPAALVEAQRWIDSGEVVIDERTSRWVAWPDRPEFEPIYGPVSLNTGAAGVAWYALNHFRVLGGDEHWRRAHRAIGFVVDAWRAHADDRFLGIEGTGAGFYGGLSGIGSVLLAFADDPDLRHAARDVFDTVLERQGATGGREGGWVGVDALLGDGGVVIGLLAAAETLHEPAYLAAAVRAGETILADERPGDHPEGGSRWPGVPASLLGASEDSELDGFELGTIGIAFVLARLALATGDSRFRSAAARAAASIAEAATVVGDAAVLPRMGGDISFGYCTGSSGVIRTFVAVHQATGDTEHLEWALRFGRGILRSGVPTRQTPGNELVLHQCCGSAAVLESFLGLWQLTGDNMWLEAAQVQGDDLLIRSVTDQHGRRWYSTSHVLPTGTLKAEVGHQVGASGIALALLRLHAIDTHANGGHCALPLRLPDDPFPTRP